jgi:O-6-methylguanine DNA methyltransferase
LRSDFTKNVLEIVSHIPRGGLMTYRQVAKAAGNAKAYRAVGNILNKNYREKEWQLPFDEIEPVPCHRVIRSDGFIGGYARGGKDKKRLLELEGHVVQNGRIMIPKLVD